MIAVIRHGERADNSPLLSDQQSIKLPFDPPLTDLGLIQSEVCGEKLSKMLLQANPLLKNIVFVSSPYLRCLQTADSMIKGIKDLKTQEIFSQTHIGEMLRSSWFPCDVNSMLTCKTNQEAMKSLLSISYDEEFVQDARLISLKYPEDKLGSFYDRFRVAFQLIVEKFRKNYDQNTTALAIITHGFGVQVVLDAMNIFSLTDMVEFCSINILDYRQINLAENKKPLIMIKQYHKHLEEAEQRMKVKQELTAKI